MRRSLLVVAVFVLFLAGLTVLASRSSAQTPNAGGSIGTTPAEMPEFTSARDKFRVNDIPGATRLLQDARAKNLDMPPANVTLFRWFVDAKNLQAARAALESAVVEVPDDPEAYMFMANIASQERRITEAKMLFEKAFSLLGKVGSTKRKELLTPQVLSGLAHVAEAREDWAGAQRQLEAWLALEPKNMAAMQRQAQCLFQQKDVPGARAILVKAFGQEPKMLVPDAVIATYYMATDDRKSSRDKVQEYLTKAMAEYPNDFKVNLLAAQWLWKMGGMKELKDKSLKNLKDAAKRADFALKLPGKSRQETLEAELVCGGIALFQKDYKAAEGFFQDAFLLDPDNFGARNNLALALIEQTDEEKRTKALKYAGDNVRASRDTQNAPEAFSTYGWVLYKLKRTDEAEQFLASVIRSGTFRTDTAYYWACILHARGRDTEATKFLEPVIQFNGPFAYREEADAMMKDLKKE
jgi:tetratricopeptide (TPR) repeat protein